MRRAMVPADPASSASFIIYYLVVTYGEKMKGPNEDKVEQLKE